MQSRKVTQARWQAQKRVFTQTRHKAVFVQASKRSLDVAKREVKSWTVIVTSPNERAKLRGQRCYAGRTHKRQPWDRWPRGPVWVTETAENGHKREDQKEGWKLWTMLSPDFIRQLSIPEMSGRLAEISAPAQGDGWFTLWPASTSHQSSHRKITSPSSEFMQTVVHLSEDKKMHFHFEIKTLKVLSKAQTKVSICLWAVSTHACCAISVGVYTTYMGSPVHYYAPLNPIWSSYFWEDGKLKKKKKQTWIAQADAPVT